MSHKIDLNQAFSLCRRDPNGQMGRLICMKASLLRSELGLMPLQNSDELLERLGEYHDVLLQDFGMINTQESELDEAA